MTTTLDLSYQSSPLTVAQGGTGKSSLTAYNLLAAGTTSTGIWQNAGTGTSNQIYVSGGSALGTWTNQDVIGAWSVITTTTISTNTASVAFTGLTTSYNAYKILISGLVPQTNATNFELLTSANNGSTYANSAGNYGYINVNVNDNGTAANNKLNSTSATAILIGGAWSNSSFDNNLEIILVDPATSYENNGAFWTGKYNDSTLGGCSTYGGGMRLNTQVNNAVKFLFSSNNIASGNFILYGLKI